VEATLHLSKTAVTFNCTALFYNRNSLGFFTCDDFSKDAGCVAKPSVMPTQTAFLDIIREVGTFQQHL